MWNIPEDGVFDFFVCQAFTEQGRGWGAIVPGCGGAGGVLKEGQGLALMELEA